MKNENNPVGKADKSQTVEKEREEGDGNDSTCSLSLQCNGNVTSTNGQLQLDNDPPKDEKPATCEKVNQTTRGENNKEKTWNSLDPEDKDRSLVLHVQEKWNDFSKKKITPELATSSCSLSFKELRKQLKQVYGHDLIRRILHTSSVGTNAESLQLSQLSTSGKSLNKVTVTSIPANLSQVLFDQVKQKTVESICKSTQPGSTKQIENCICPDRLKSKQGDPEGTLLQVAERSLPVRQEKRGELQLHTERKKVEPDHLHTCDRQSPQTAGIIDRGKYSAQQIGVLNVGHNQQSAFQMMRSSKACHGEKNSQPPQNDSSDHSDSVVSLESSSSDDSKPNPREPSSEDANIPLIQTESLRDVTEPRETRDLQKGGDMLNHDVDRLHQRIQEQPTQDTLDEIIHMLKTQKAKDSPLLAHDGTEQRLGSQMSWPQDSSLEGNPYRATQPYPSSLTWNTSVPPLSLTVGQMGGQKLREKHSRQLKDVAAHYESEIDKLRDQLDEVRNNLTALQETLPVKQLESENHKLETRCHVLEQVCEQLKNKLVRLEQAHQELDSVCGQLKQVNQNLEVRCLYLEQVNQTNESERSHLQQNIRDLEAKVLELVESSERAIATCRHLEDANHKFEAKNQALEESQALLETHYKSCIGENQKLDAQVFQLQKTLDESSKKCKELEDSVVVLHRKKESLAVELQASNKAGMTTQQRFEEMKSMCSSKDELISRLENELRDLSSFVEKTVKEKAQSEQESKRDRELLQRMLIEYDVLAKNHLEARSSSKAVQEKLDVSQDEINSLRGTISKLISRNNSLEESLKDVSNQENKSSDYFKPFSGRRTWDHSSPIKKADTQAQSLKPPYAVTEPEKRSPVTESATNSRPYCGSPGPTGTLPSTAAAKTSTLPGRKQEPTSLRPKAGQAKRNLMKGYGESAKEGTDVKQAQHKTPGGMVVKKADLVTRFDVVFEDSSSGKEVLRTHTGRTRRNFGEPAHTELSFVEGEGTHHKSTAEAALTAVKEGRVLAMGDSENKNMSRASKSKQQSMYNVPEKDLGDESAQSTAKEKTSDGDGENDVYTMERKFSLLSEERKRLESTLSRIPSQKMTKRTKEDKAYLEDRLEDVVKEIGSVRMQLKRHHAL